MKVLPCLKRPKLDGREAEVGQYLKNKKQLHDCLGTTSFEMLKKRD